MANDKLLSQAEIDAILGVAKKGQPAAPPLKKDSKPAEPVQSPPVQVKPVQPMSVQAKPEQSTTVQSIPPVHNAAGNSTELESIRSSVTELRRQILKILDISQRIDMLTEKVDKLDRNMAISSNKMKMATGEIESIKIQVADLSQKVK